MQNASLASPAAAAPILHYLFSISPERHPGKQDAGWLEAKNNASTSEPPTARPDLIPIPIRIPIPRHTLRMRDGWGCVHLKCKIVLYAAKMAASRWLICMHDVRALMRPSGQKGGVGRWSRPAAACHPKTGTDDKSILGEFK